MSMSLDDTIFWIAITVFGAGLYLVPEYRVWGIVLMFIGTLGILYSIRAHLRGPARPIGVMVILMMFTWAAVGYDIYDRHYGQHTGRSDLLIVNLPDQPLDPGMIANSLNHTPLLPLSAEQTKRLNLLRALAANWNEYPYKQVYDRSFNDESVLLDGRDFIRCTFTNVKLVYEGTAPFRTEESTFTQTSGPWVLETDNPIVTNVLNALVYQDEGSSKNIPSLP